MKLAVWALIDDIKQRFSIAPAEYESWLMATGNK